MLFALFKKTEIMGDMEYNYIYSKPESLKTNLESSYSLDQTDLSDINLLSDLKRKNF
jgi:hypothetical protein